MKKTYMKVFYTQICASGPKFAGSGKDIVISMKLREEYTCPLELVHCMIKGKWKTIIL